jgi:hypothetical protein
VEEDVSRFKEFTPSERSALLMVIADPHHVGEAQAAELFALSRELWEATLAESDPIEALEAVTRLPESGDVTPLVPPQPDAVPQDLLDTEDTVGLPHDQFERRHGESESEFSLRMAQVQAERANRRRQRSVATISPIAKGTAVWGGVISGPDAA